MQMYDEKKNRRGAGTAEYRLKGFIETIEDAQNTGASQAVKYVLTPPFINDDTGVFENGQMTGEGGHVDIEQFEQDTNALFALAEFFDDPEPRGMSKRFKNFSLVLDRQAGRKF